MEVCLMGFLGAIVYGRTAFLWTALLILTGLLVTKKLFGYFILWPL